jgi:hypothetical protein
LPAPPVQTPPPPQLPIAEQFDAEPVDRFWKTNTEAELRRRVPKASAIDCHQTLCRITLAGSELDVSTQSEELVAERSLHGLVGSVVLTAPAKHADGTLELRAYARFSQ